MLVLTRQSGHPVLSTLVITDREGNRIEVSVKGVRRDGQVSLVIDAPRSVRVDRAEVWEERRLGRGR